MLASAAASYQNFYAAHLPNVTKRERAKFALQVAVNRDEFAYGAAFIHRGYGLSSYCCLTMSDTSSSMAVRRGTEA